SAIRKSSSTTRMRLPCIVRPARPLQSATPPSSPSSNGVNCNRLKRTPAPRNHSWRRRSARAPLGGAPAVAAVGFLGTVQRLVRAGQQVFRHRNQPAVDDVVGNREGKTSRSHGLVAKAARVVEE